jgi:hypothetical protein
MAILAGQLLCQKTPCHKRVTNAVSMAVLLPVSFQQQAFCCFVC